MVRKFGGRVLYNRMTTVNDIEQLFRSNFKSMLCLANSLIHDEEVARDIVHDIFTSLLTDCPDSVNATYLHNGVRFACLNHIRDLTIRQRLYKLYALEINDIDDFEEPDEDEINRINRIVINDLSEQCQRVVRLRFSGQLKYREIAEELRISEIAVYKHLRHALNVLRQKLNHNGE